MDYNLVNAQRAMFLTGRGLLGLYFILPGISKIIGFAGMSEYMAAHEVPFVHLLLVLTIILQIGCGASLVAGWRAQLMAFVLAGATPRLESLRTRQSFCIRWARAAWITRTCWKP